MAPVCRSLERCGKQLHAQYVRNPLCDPTIMAMYLLVTLSIELDLSDCKTSGHADHEDCESIPTPEVFGWNIPKLDI